MAEDAVKTIEGAGRTTAEVDKLYERMGSIEAEIINLRQGYIIVNTRYTVALVR